MVPRNIVNGLLPGGAVFSTATQCHRSLVALCANSCSRYSSLTLASILPNGAQEGSFKKTTFKGSARSSKKRRTPTREFIACGIT